MRYSLRKPHKTPNNCLKQGTTKKPQSIITRLGQLIKTKEIKEMCCLLSLFSSYI